eukprot:CFRG2685T1
MKFTIPSVLPMVGLAVYIATSGSQAAPSKRGLPTDILISTGLVDVEVEHSLTSSEWEHLKRVTQAFYDEGGDYQYVASNFGTTDEYSVKPGDSDECLVMIAATDSITEWISNANFPYSTLSSGGQDILKAHSGFVIAAKAMDEDGLLEKIQNNCGSRDVVTFSGHSRGGGIAQVLASWYYQQGTFNTIKLVSWGSPRGLTDSSADNFHTDYYQVRVINDNDPIPSLPTEAMGYKHFGSVVCLDCTDTSQDAEGGFSLNIFNHAMGTYNTKIQSISV